MSIKLTYPILYAGAHVPVDGATLSYAADLEADLVNRNMAVYVSNPAQGGLVPVMASKNFTGKSIFSGGLSSYLLPRGGVIRMSALGDSISNRDSAATWIASGLNGPLISGMVFCTQMISNGAVQLVAGWAVGGYTTAQMANTVQSNGKTLLQSSIDDSSNCVAVLAGTNDTYGMPTPKAAADIFQDILDLWEPIIEAGKAVIAHTIPPQSPSTPSTAIQRAAAQQVNQLIRDYCTEGDIMLVDLAAMWRSADGTNQGANTVLLLNESSSYIHPNESGGMVAATERWRVLQMHGAASAPTEGVGLDSPYSIGTNPHGVGSNATAANRTVLGTGVSGTGPDGWNIARTGTSTVTVNPTAVARNDNRAGQSIQMTIAIAAGGEQIKTYNAYNGALNLTGNSTTTNLRGNLTLYAAGQVKQFSDTHWYKTLVLGTTGATEPGTLPATIGGIVADATQVWMRLPDIVPGSSWIRQVAEVVFTAHAVANIAPYAYIRQYATGYANLAAAVLFDDNDGIQLLGNNGVVGSAANIVYGGSLPGNNGYAPGVLPLNIKLRLATPWVRVAADCAIVEPCLSIIGGAGATATVLINHLDTQIRR